MESDSSDEFELIARDEAAGWRDQRRSPSIFGLLPWSQGRAVAQLPLGTAAAPACLPHGQPAPVSSLAPTGVPLSVAAAPAVALHAVPPSRSDSLASLQLFAVSRPLTATPSAGSLEPLPQPAPPPAALLALGGLAVANEQEWQQHAALPAWQLRPLSRHPSSSSFCSGISVCSASSCEFCAPPPPPAAPLAAAGPRAGPGPQPLALPASSSRHSLGSLSATLSSPPSSCGLADQLFAEAEVTPAASERSVPIKRAPMPAATTAEAMAAVGAAHLPEGAPPPGMHTVLVAPSLPGSQPQAQGAPLAAGVAAAAGGIGEEGGACGAPASLDSSPPSAAEPAAPAAGRVAASKPEASPSAILAQQRIDSPPAGLPNTLQALAKPKPARLQQQHTAAAAGPRGGSGASSLGSSAAPAPLMRRPVTHRAAQAAAEHVHAIQRYSPAPGSPGPAAATPAAAVAGAQAGSSSSSSGCSFPSLGYRPGWAAPAFASVEGVLWGVAERRLRTGGRALLALLAVAAVALVIGVGALGGMRAARYLGREAAELRLQQGAAGGPGGVVAARELAQEREARGQREAWGAAMMAARGQAKGVRVVLLAARDGDTSAWGVARDSVSGAWRGREDAPTGHQRAWGNAALAAPSRSST